MKDLYLSCIHIGSPLFKDVLPLTTLLQKNYRKVYLVGDIFDIWEMPWNSIRSSYGSIIQLIEKVSREKPVYYLIGNHDPPITTLESTFPKMEITHYIRAEMGGYKVSIKHGNDLDNYFIRSEWIAKPLYYSLVHPFTAAGLNIRDYLRNKLNNFLTDLQGKPYNSIVLDIEKKAVRKYRYIIMGHTHVKKVIQKDIWYINPGDWIFNRTYAEYDIDTSTFMLKDVYYEGQEDTR